MARPPARTLLQQLIQDVPWTYGEVVRSFDHTARRLRESATLSEGHLQRLASGRRGGNVSPATQRVLRAMFGRSLLELLGPPRPGSAAATAAASRPAEALPGSGSDVTSIRAMVAGFQAADRQAGGGKLYPTVAGYLRNEIAPRLLDPTTGGGAGLFAAAASVCEIAGWMAHDGGDDQRARAHFTQAYRLAAGVDSPGLLGNLCWSMSHLAIQMRQPVDAIRIADTGLARVDGARAGRRLASKLHVMRAHGFARARDDAACRDALHQAQAAIAGAYDGAEDAEQWVTPFDDASLAAETALCLHGLGDLAAAERQARDVVAARAGDRVRSRSFAQLTLARVLCDQGRLDEAAAVGVAVCDAAPGLASERVFTQLAGLETQLLPHRSGIDVGTFVDRAEALRTSRTAPTVEENAWPI